MQLTIKKEILDIKLRDRPVANISHNEKCAKAMGANAHCSLGHVPEESLAPLDELCNTQENHQCINIIDTLTSDGTSTGRKRNDIPCADAHKSNNLLYNRMPPFGMNKCVMIRSRLEKSGARITIVVNRRKRELESHK